MPYRKNDIQDGPVEENEKRDVFKLSYANIDEISHIELDKKTGIISVWYTIKEIKDVSPETNNN